MDLVALGSYVVGQIYIVVESQHVSYKWLHERGYATI